jgi:hypothetical protein
MWVSDVSTQHGGLIFKDPRKVRDAASKSLAPILPGRDATSLKNKDLNYAAAKAGMPALKLLNT